MTPVYLGQFSDAENVFANFEDTVYGWNDDSSQHKVADKGIEILLAYYEYENYEGDAFVLFRKDGLLYEVHGGHCSCYGLEGQWSPEETSVKDLRHRLTKGYLGRSSWTGENRFADELSQLLDEIEEAAE